MERPQRARHLDAIVEVAVGLVGIPAGERVSGRDAVCGAGGRRLEGRVRVLALLDPAEKLAGDALDTEKDALHALRGELGDGRSIAELVRPRVDPVPEMREALVEHRE